MAFFDGNPLGGRRAWTWPVCALVAAATAVPAALGVDMHCVDRDGRCMQVTVNGQKAVKLGKATKKLLANLKVRGAEARSYISEVRYEVLAPVRGALDVAADRSSDSK